MEDMSDELFNEESFIDSSITDYHLDFNKKKILLLINGGYLNDDAGRCLSKSSIDIKNWDNLQVFERRGVNIKKFSKYPKEFLTSIIKFHRDGADLKLVGLGYNCWVDWVFTNVEVTIRGEVKDHIQKKTS